MWVTKKSGFGRFYQKSKELLDIFNNWPENEKNGYIPIAALTRKMQLGFKHKDTKALSQKERWLGNSAGIFFRDQSRPLGPVTRGLNPLTLRDFVP